MQTMMAISDPPAKQSPKATGRVTKLAAYTTEAGERRLVVGRRVGCVVNVFDVAERVREGRMFKVESGMHDKAELVGLVREYKAEAERYGDCPMVAYFRRLLVLRGDEEP